MLHLYLIQNIDYIPCVEYFCRIFILWLKIYTSYSSTSTVHLHTLLSPLVTTNLFSVSVSLLVFVASLIRCVFIFYIGVLSYSICISLNTNSLKWNSLSITPSKSIHVATHGELCSFPDWVVLHMYIIHSTVDGCLGYFPVLAVINNATMNTLGCMYLFKLVFLCFHMYQFGQKLVWHLMEKPKWTFWPIWYTQEWNRCAIYQFCI